MILQRSFQTNAVHFVSSNVRFVIKKIVFFIGLRNFEPGIDMTCVKFVTQIHNLFYLRHKLLHFVISFKVFFCVKHFDKLLEWFNQEKRSVLSVKLVFLRILTIWRLLDYLLIAISLVEEACVTLKFLISNFWFFCRLLDMIYFKTFEVKC